jgi:hypothetical protein
MVRHSIDRAGRFDAATVPFSTERIGSDILRNGEKPICIIKGDLQ